MFWYLVYWNATPLKDFIHRDARLSEHRTFLLNKSRLKERLRRTRCFLRRPRFSSVAGGCYSRSIITLLGIYSNSQSRRDVRTNECVREHTCTPRDRNYSPDSMQVPTQTKAENFNLKVFPHGSLLRSVAQKPRNYIEY